MGRQNTQFMVNIKYIMEIDKTSEKITKKLFTDTSPTRLFLSVVAISLILGGLTGFILANKGSKTTGGLTSIGAAKSPQQDARTFRDFAEGTLRKRPEPSDPSEYVEGTHFLQRPGAIPVALTSSVVDLSQYENKKVKVFGETQKAVKEGWLMDVGKVEEIK